METSQASIPKTTSYMEAASCLGYKVEADKRRCTGKRNHSKEEIEDQTVPWPNSSRFDTL